MATTTQQSSQYFVIKGRFKAVDTNTFGLFIIFLDSDHQNVDTITVLASHFSSMFETEPTEGWASIEERMQDLKWKGEFATSISRDAQVALETSLNNLRAEELNTLIKSNAEGKIQNLLSVILVKPLADKNISIDVAWETATSEQIQAVRNEREQRSAGQVESPDAPAGDSDFVVEEGSVVLDVKLVLSPVSGIPIFEIKPGDKIMVKIDPTSKRGLYFIELLNAKNENDILAIPATVNEVKIGKANEYLILMKIGEGIYGKVSETEQVKIRRFNPETDRKAATNVQGNLAAAGYTKTTKKNKKEGGASLQWLWYLGGFLALAVLWFLVATLV